MGVYVVGVGKGRAVLERCHGMVPCTMYLVS